MITLLGLKGPKRCGKDRFFRSLAACTPATRCSIGDEIRKEVCARTGIPADVLDGEEKEFYRPLLQWWGAYRRQADQDYWMVRLARQIDAAPDGLVVVTDIRGFPDELAMLATRGGKVVRIKRDGTGVGDPHPSETLYASTPEDYVIDNNGTTGALLGAARDLLARLGHR